MNDDLKYIFDTTNEWLKFAEAKNAGILALLVGLIAGLISMTGDLSGWQATMLIISESIFAVAILICLCSLSPILNDKFYAQIKLDAAMFEKLKQSVNLLFFKSIYRLTEQQFIEVFNSRANVSAIQPASYDITTGTHALNHDLVHQILVNACIANFKYCCFKVTIWFTCGGIIVVAIPLFSRWCQG